MARFVHGSPIRQGRLGALPAAFNPVTIAHLALADAAAEQASLDQVVFVLPQVQPHKDYSGTSFERRLEMLVAAVEPLPRPAVAATEGGLFIEIAREMSDLCGSDVSISLICGRDAAERIVEWDYGDGPSFAAQLKEFELLVADRNGEYVAPARFSGRIRAFGAPSAAADVSSSEIRRRLQAGEPWESLVPSPAATIIRREGYYMV